MIVEVDDLQRRGILVIDLLRGRRHVGVERAGRHRRDTGARAERPQELAAFKRGLFPSRHGGVLQFRLKDIAQRRPGWRDIDRLASSKLLRATQARDHGDAQQVVVLAGHEIALHDLRNLAHRVFE